MKIKQQLTSSPSRLPKVSRFLLSQKCAPLSPAADEGVIFKNMTREISPAINCSAEEFLSMMPPEMKEIVFKIRDEKNNKTRPLPSVVLIENSDILTGDVRKELIDKIAMLVDENLTGRSDMCQQFSMLLSMSLNTLGVYAKSINGKATYNNGFSWQHFWVETKDEIIDANVDMLYENPMFPHEIIIKPYWGKKTTLPKDRKLQSKKTKTPPDSDVSKIWWPELKLWLKKYNN